jgi:multidrug efflux pump
MDRKKRNIVEWAMHYRQIVILITCILVGFGVFALSKINKNEFPDFTVRQGIVVAAYPGASAEDIEEQVTKPLEDYIFSYKEVKKEKTKSYSRDGMAIIQVELNDELDNKDEFWSKFKHGINGFKSQLPSGVLALMVQDDFGDTSALLITMESKDKTYRELNEYMKQLKDSLRTVESVGRMNVLGMQKEQISVYLDNEKLAHYGISDKTIALWLFQKGFVTMSGTQKSADYNSPIYVKRSVNMIQDVERMIIYSDPTGHNVRLGDVARVVQEYPKPTSVITNNGTKCLVLSVEMKKGRNITDMGEQIDRQLDAFEESLPQDVSLYKITDQSKVVNDSVTNFLHELLIAIIAVVVVVMLLLPWRVALVAASTIPVSIFISLGLFHALGIELNTVTLAALIVTLGMIVDNSIVIIDSYVERLGEGQSRWHASIESASEFFKSIFSATMAISITFFPFLLVVSGMYYDFLKSFPWAITIVLLVSLLVAELVVPFMQFWFIRKPTETQEKKKFNLMDWLQKYYDWLLDKCFAHPYATMAVGLVSVALGIAGYTLLPKQLLPVADRNQFAVEITLPSGSSFQRTTEIADSLERVLRSDSMIVSVASFKGMSSPRFHTAYAPQLGGSNFAQLIVNTQSPKATEEMLDKYQDKYAEAFPEAYVRFKQLSYRQEIAPIEIRVSGSDLAGLHRAADSIVASLRDMPELELVRTDMNEPLRATEITLKEDEASRLLVTNADVELSTALRYNSDGIPLATVWNGDYDVNVKLKGDKADLSTPQDIANERIATYAGLGNVPLRQVADIQPAWHYGQINHRNGLRTVSILAEHVRNVNTLAVTDRVKHRISNLQLPQGVRLEYGGNLAENEENNPKMMRGLALAVVIIFFILLGHFRRIRTAVLLLISLSLVILGAVVGTAVIGVEWGVTSTLGIISLMGILVRNAIIMYDYAEVLRTTEHLTAHQAIYESAKRRMRPIFLTSAAASMGVIPMIVGGSSLWMPMGSVIFFGTIITMILILTMLPVGYWLMMSGTTKKRNEALTLENE